MRVQGEVIGNEDMEITGKTAGESESIDDQLKSCNCAGPQASHAGLRTDLFRVQISTPKIENTEPEPQSTRFVVQISRCKTHHPNIKVEDYPRTACEKNEVALDYGLMRNRHKVGPNGLHVVSRWLLLHD